MGWQSYELDRVAQGLVLDHREQDVLNESHKMRTTVAYGLERFWGEHLRLLDNQKKADDRAKGEYWLATWTAFVEIMKQAEVAVPQGVVHPDDTTKIREVAEQFWDREKFPLEDQRISLAVLTQLCDCLVWWTQRYKKKGKGKVKHER